MAKIQELLSGKNDEINVDEILVKNGWIKEEKQKCILSPDSDRLLCGLFLSHYLDWEIVGFYDGKVTLIKDGLSFYDDDVNFINPILIRKRNKKNTICIYLEDQNQKLSILMLLNQIV